MQRQEGCRRPCPKEPAASNKYEGVFQRASGALKSRSKVTDNGEKSSRLCPTCRRVDCKQSRSVSQDSLIVRSGSGGVASALRGALARMLCLEGTLARQLLHGHAVGRSRTAMDRVGRLRWSLPRPGRRYNGSPRKCVPVAASIRSIETGGQCSNEKRAVSR
jgi:hypothetical protein